MDEPDFNQDVVTLFMLGNLETLTTFFSKKRIKEKGSQYLALASIWRNRIQLLNQQTSSTESCTPNAFETSL